jgi:hypothetical protein
MKGVRFQMVMSVEEKEVLGRLATEDRVSIGAMLRGLVLQEAEQRYPRWRRVRGICADCPLVEQKKEG